MYLSFHFHDSSSQTYFWVINITSFRSLSSQNLIQSVKAICWMFLFLHYIFSSSKLRTTLNIPHHAAITFYMTMIKHSKYLHININMNCIHYTRLGKRAGKWRKCSSGYSALGLSVASYQRCFLAKLFLIYFMTCLGSHGVQDKSK